MRTIAVVAMLALAGPAAAQDWAGGYIGGGISGNDGFSYRETWTVLPVEFSGISGDVRAGYLFDLGPAAAGIEVLFSPTPISGRHDFPVGAWWKFTVSNTFTARAKAGLPLNRFMPYAAAGVSWTSFTYDNSADGAATFAAVGPNLAAGVEWMATDHISLGVEASVDVYGETTFNHGGWISHATARPARVTGTALFRF